MYKQKEKNMTMANGAEAETKEEAEGVGRVAQARGSARKQDEEEALSPSSTTRRDGTNECKQSPEGRTRGEGGEEEERGREERGREEEPR